MTAPASQPFTFRQIPVIAEMLRERSIDIAPLLAAHGLPADAATQELTTAPLHRIQALVEDAATALDAPLFGLDLAERIPRGAFGMTEFVVRASPTVEDGLAALCEFSPLINPLNELRYIADTHGCEIHAGYGGIRDGLGMHLNEFTVSVLSRSFSSVLDKALPIERAWFAHMRRSHADDVARRFGCSVGFQSPDSGFAVTSDTTSHRIPTADPALFKFLTTQARTQLANLPAGNVPSQVVRAIEKRLAVSDVSANAIAESIGMTARTLQRHLADAAMSYREVLLNVRLRRKAELERTGMAEADIATRLGFANARTMQRSLAAPESDNDASGSDS